MSTTRPLPCCYPSCSELSTYTLNSNWNLVDQALMDTCYEHMPKMLMILSRLQLDGWPIASISATRKAIP